MTEISRTEGDTILKRLDGAIPNPPKLVVSSLGLQATAPVNGLDRAKTWATVSPGTSAADGTR